MRAMVESKKLMCSDAKKPLCWTLTSGSAQGLFCFIFYFLLFIFYVHENLIRIRLIMVLSFLISASLSLIIFCCFRILSLDFLESSSARVNGPSALFFHVGSYDSFCRLSAAVIASAYGSDIISRIWLMDVLIPKWDFFHHFGKIIS